MRRAKQGMKVTVQGSLGRLVAEEVHQHIDNGLDDFREPYGTNVQNFNEKLAIFL
jgi:hypothetical protein